jgi:glycosyltransferase involved in cell wall biosynthesis
MDRVEVDEDWTVYRIRQLRTLPTSRITDREQRHSPPFSDPISARDAAAAIDAFRPDVCISYGWITLSALGALKRRRIPVLLSAHDYGYFCPTRTLLNQGEPCSGPAPLKCLSCAGDFYGPTTGTGAVLGLLAARPRLANGVAGLHTVSSFVDEVTWGNLFGPKGPLHHVRRFIIPPFIEEPPPITPEQRVEYAPYLAQLPDEPFIMFAGALRAIKGVDVLLAAYRQLREPRPPLVMMGHRYHDTPTDLPPGVRIIESVPQRVVMAALERAMLGAYPSVWPEPLGTVVIEASRSGVPAIGTQPSGIVDVLSDGRGILVQRGSVEELRDAMQRLIDDPALRAQISETGRQNVERFAASHVVEQYERALVEIVSDRVQRVPELATGRSPE